MFPGFFVILARSRLAIAKCDYAADAYSARNVAVGECIDTYMYAPGQEKPEVNEMPPKNQASGNRHPLQQINRSYMISRKISKACRSEGGRKRLCYKRE